MINKEVLWGIQGRFSSLQHQPSPEVPAGSWTLHRLQDPTAPGDGGFAWRHAKSGGQSNPKPGGFPP